MKDFTQRLSLVLVLGGLLILAGCGESGPPRYHISGSVSQDGKPIPAGSVTFIPDSSQGNSGPAVSVKITNGQFDTTLEGGVGHVGGPHTVKITALDGVSDEEFPDGVPMFPAYELKLDLPKADGTQDIEVPADWVKPPPGPPQDTA